MERDEPGMLSGIQRFRPTHAEFSRHRAAEATHRLQRWRRIKKLREGKALPRAALATYTRRKFQKIANPGTRSRRLARWAVVDM
jgi:hypothetical protein